MIEKVFSAVDVRCGNPCRELAAKVGVEAQYVINVERIRGDDEFLACVVAACFQPSDIFVSGAPSRNWVVPKVSGNMMRSAFS